MLRVLAERYPLAVVTSRSQREAAAFLAQYGLSDLFHVIITRDNVRRLKPHPMPVRTAAEKLGVPPEQCVMVGDTGVDVRSAKAAGALVVAVLCGFGEMNDFGDADLVIDSTAQLGEWLRQSLPSLAGIRFSITRTTSASPTVITRYRIGHHVVRLEEPEGAGRSRPCPAG